MRNRKVTDLGYCLLHHGSVSPSLQVSMRDVWGCGMHCVESRDGIILMLHRQQWPWMLCFTAKLTWEIIFILVSEPRRRLVICYEFVGCVAFVESVESAGFYVRRTLSRHGWDDGVCNAYHGRHGEHSRHKERDNSRAQASSRCRFVVFVFSAV